MHCVICLIALLMYLEASLCAYPKRFESSPENSAWHLQLQLAACMRV